MSEPLLANRFRIDAELGSGAMGAVYRVTDTLGDGRALALKTIKSDGPVTAELRLRFKEEFRAMASLKHPNTIEVFDYGQLDDDTQYLTMEIVAGQDLSELINERPLALKTIYPLLIQLLQALEFIHSRLFVHRDIKAQNVRVRTDGTLKLMDFGLMGQLGIAVSSGKISGSPGYLPPEVVKGGVIDAASDLYSVGCLAYEMLCGHPPFRGRLLEVVRAHVGQPPPPLRGLVPELPERLERVVLKLLAKEQRERYQTAGEVIIDLAALAGLDVTRQNLQQKASYLVASSLVGRAHDLETLRTALQRARAGAGRAVFVGAPAGVGKSRLIQELVMQAKLDDVLVLTGHCLETGLAPYEPLAQALRPLLAATTPAELARHASGLRALFPELAGESPPPGAALDETVRLWLGEVAARRPILLYLEDTHWADLKSLEVFNHVIRHLASLPVLALASFRDDELLPGAPALHAVEEGLAKLTSLRAFDAQETVALVLAMLPKVLVPPEVATVLYASTAGNAFFITETLRWLMEENLLLMKYGTWRFPADMANQAIPTSIEDTVSRRLAHASEGALALARVASVLGRSQDLGLLLYASGLEEDVLFARLDELVARQFIHREQQPEGRARRYTFPHDKVRETLYADLPATLARELHQRCGEFIERAAAGAAAPPIHELAYHFSRGHDLFKAYGYLWQAGALAKRLGVVAGALDCWQQAEAVLVQVEHPHKDQELIKLWHLIGASSFELRPSAAIAATERLMRVQRTLEVIQDVAATENELPRYIQSYAYLALAYGFAGHPARSLILVDRLLHLLPQAGPLLKRTLPILQGPALLAAGRFDALVRVAHEAAGALFTQDLTGQSPLLLSMRIGAASYQMACAYQGIRPLERDMEAALWAAEQIGAFNFYNTIPHYFAIWHAWTGRQAQVQQYLDATVQNCRKIGAPPHPWVLYFRPYLLWQRGEFAEALAQVRQAHQHPHFAQADYILQLTRVLEGQIQLGLGNWDAAEAEFAAAEASGGARGMHLVSVLALLGRGEVALARGQWRAAQASIVEAYEIALSGEARNPLHQAIAARLLGEVAFREGRLSQAEAAVRLALAIVSAPGQDNLIEQGHGQRLQAEVQLAGGDKAAGLASLRAAGELYFQLKNHFWLHRVTERLAAVLAAESAPKPLPLEERWLKLRFLQ